MLAHINIVRSESYMYMNGVTGVCMHICTRHSNRLHCAVWHALRTYNKNLVSSASLDSSLSSIGDYEDVPVYGFYKQRTALKPEATFYSSIGHAIGEVAEGLILASAHC